MAIGTVLPAGGLGFHGYRHPGRVCRAIGSNADVWPRAAGADHRRCSRPAPGRRGAGYDPATGHDPPFRLFASPPASAREGVRVLGGEDL